MAAIFPRWWANAQREPQWIFSHFYSSWLIIPEKFSLNQILFVLFFYIDWTSYELCLLLKIKLVVLVPLKNISGPIFQTYVSIQFVEKNINLQNDWMCCRNISVNQHTQHWLRAAWGRCGTKIAITFLFIKSPRKTFFSMNAQ